MTIQEKAAQIISLFDKFSFHEYHTRNAKQCAIICVEQIIEVLGGAGVDGWADPDISKYWQEVINHLKNS